MAVTIDGSTGVTYSDNIKHKYGTSGDLEVYHDGSHSYIDGVAAGTGYLILKSKQLQIKNDAADEKMVVADANGSVELYYNGNLKFSTTSAGANFEGNGSDYVMVDLHNTGSGVGSQMRFRNDHAGTPYIGIANDTSGDYIIYSEGYIKVKHGGDVAIKSAPNGAVELYYDNSKKFETKSNGAEVTGHFDPAAGNSYDLGYDHRWRILYTNNNVNVSDRNEKQNITDSDLGLDFVNKLTPVSYRWKVDNLGGKKQYGLIAQDVEQVILDSGKTLDDFGGIDKREGKSMGLSYHQLISPLIKAVQELSAEVNTLKTKVAALESHTHE